MFFRVRNKLHVGRSAKQALVLRSGSKERVKDMAQEQLENSGSTAHGGGCQICRPKVSV